MTRWHLFLPGPEALAVLMEGDRPRGAVLIAGVVRTVDALEVRAWLRARGYCAAAEELRW